MNEIGELLRTTRESSGVSLEEASGDLEIKTLILENIEDGNIGCFKDIFALKQNIYDYAKYLGFEPDKIIDDFNEYLFEYTSKIPLEDIEKAMKEKQKDEIVSDKIVSPYTNSTRNVNSKIILAIIIALGVLVLLVIFWSVRQLAADNMATNMVSYVDSRNR